MELGIISLLLLAVAIAIGFFRKTNVGLVCLLFAFVLGKVAGIPTAEILKGFKPNLFINLMGVTLLFSILNKNGTIELLARKIVSLAGSNKYLIPIAVFLMGALLTGIGPGSIPLLARGLASFMSPMTAPALMGLTGGIMSWFSSANGVVFPTLIPTVPQVAANVGGASLLQMVAAIVCSATVAGISPMSTGGSLVMASCSQEKSGKGKESDSALFAKLFGVSALCVTIIFVFTLVGGLSFLH